ncbi:hypothetical protein K438DRAFT_2019847 [Mycena galopus ATCC 62051]|nr:hypothetical protein K438DRAFT_2019847 [Mycena galopus ATCC 62051]
MPSRGTLSKYHCFLAFYARCRILFSPTPTPAMDQQPPQGRHGHFVPLLKIVAAWVVALALAAGHHAFYASLNNTVPTSDSSGTNASLLVHSQAGASAIGTTFAFIVSAALSVSAGTAFLQCAWRVVRSRAFTVSGLDAMWSSPTNMFAFLSLDFWRKARGIVIISGLAWAFPLVVTFAPGTLTVNTEVFTTSEPCSIPTFDFGATDLLYTVLSSASTPYQAPSSIAQRLVGATLLGGQPLPPTSPCGNNCSYVVSANAPSFSCSIGAQSPSALNWTWDVPEISTPPPYFAATTDIMPPNANNSFLDWDFQAHYTNYTSWQTAPDGGMNITCIAYNSTYSVNYTFVGTTPSVVIDQIITQQRANQLSPNDTEDTFIPDLPGVHNYWYNGTANYRALFDTIYDAYGEGSVDFTDSLSGALFNYTPASLQIGQTPLVNAAASDLARGTLIWIPGEEIPSFFESLMQNVTLSILAGSLDPTQTSSTQCLVTSSEPHFVYNPHRLWLIYGLGLGVALLCDFIGLIALFQNTAVGATGSTFSDFLSATRNPELNALNLREKGRIRLQYGPIASEGGRYAFGIPGSLGYSGKEVDTPLFERPM